MHLLSYIDGNDVSNKVEMQTPVTSMLFIVSLEHMRCSCSFKNLEQLINFHERENSNDKMVADRGFPQSVMSPCCKSCAPTLKFQ